MSTSPIPCPTAGDEQAKAYLATVVRTVQRHAARAYGVDVADDLVQLVATQFWSRRAHYMEAYAPEVFAAVALRSRADELRRSERIQRGQGARLVDSPDGLRRPGRELVRWEDHVAAGGEPSHGDDVAERATDVALVHELLAGLSERDRRLVMLVDGHGQPVGEAAKAIGLSRAYANRQLTRIRAELRKAVSAA